LYIFPLTATHDLCYEPQLIPEQAGKQEMPAHMFTPGTTKIPAFAHVLKQVYNPFGTLFRRIYEIFVEGFRKLHGNTARLAGNHGLLFP
jgi:hypothetical protein